MRFACAAERLDKYLPSSRARVPSRSGEDPSIVDDSPAASPRKPLKRSGLAAVALSLVAAGAVIGLLVYIGSQASTGPSEINIVRVHWTFSSCWNSTFTPGPGWVRTLSPFELNLTLTGPATQSCTVRSVSATSPLGMTIRSSNTPLVVPQGSSVKLIVLLSYDGVVGSSGTVEIEALVG